MKGLSFNLYALMTLLLGAASCGEDHVLKMGAEPVVVVSGERVVLEMQQEIRLEAITLNGVDTGYCWLSSDGQIATVDEWGLVTARSEGEILITAMGLNTGVSGSLCLAVRERTDGALVVIYPENITLAMGESSSLKAFTLQGEDSAYRWESSDTTVASVDETGLVTALIPGQALIMATGKDSDATGILTLLVEQPQVVVTAKSMTLSPGEAVQLNAVTLGGQEEAYSWASSNPAVASVDEEGVVTAMATGQSQITATGRASGVSNSLWLVVSQSP